jgi:hypothetical protein
MDDVLLASSEESQLHLIFDNTCHALVAFGLSIVTKKVQKQAPYSYLKHIDGPGYNQHTLNLDLTV